MAKAKPATKEDDILSAIQGQTKVIGDLATAINLLLQNQIQPKPLVKPKVEATLPKRRGRKPGKKVEEVLNKFDGMKEFKAHKSDVKIDKKLWKDREPAERRQTNSRVEIQCSECKKKVKVVAGEVGEDSAYKCNNCIIGKRG